LEQTTEDEDRVGETLPTPDPGKNDPDSMLSSAVLAAAKEISGEDSFAPWLQSEAPIDLPEPPLVHRLWTEVAVLRERLRATEAIAAERENRIEDLRFILRMLAEPANAQTSSGKQANEEQVVVVPDSTQVGATSSARDAAATRDGPGVPKEVAGIWDSSSPRGWAADTFLGSPQPEEPEAPTWIPPDEIPQGGEARKWLRRPSSGGKSRSWSRPWRKR
jgi:hypothetical protein